jgi:hypothetical protein
MRNSAGFNASVKTVDLHSVMTYVGNRTIGSADTLYIYSALITILDGSTGDLTDQALAAKLWVRDYLNEGCGCCGLYTGGLTGNTNCDPDGQVNLADITRLIDFVYISQDPLCCTENGDVNGDGTSANLADITRLIDNVYISHDATAACH